MVDSPKTSLIPVTIGNIIGGVIFVALVYWVIYLCNKQTLSS
jgi:formate transporter